ncbi:uncharacterized protein LOC135712954, partial [Ochlerotatus camptorhynchus]|uniref:uncharacterized protein LOC135712954 n=1 Tax=Ochlerotatus camptorhynchus TaxID=644619 RepID=UPI0031DD869D
STQIYGAEPQFLPDERTSLDDCHLRFYNFDSEESAGTTGLSATQFEFAHMGAIGWIQPGDGRILWKCGASLIWDNFVLTAAHCVVDSMNKPPDVVRFGDLDIFSTVGDEFAQQFKIAEIIRHPSHRFNGHYHDVALMRLEKSVTINEAVIPACLWLDEEVRFKRMHATGWGNVGFVGKQSPVLLKMELDPVSNQECSMFYNNDTSRKLSQGLAGHHICAFNSEADTCEGDSGGPLQIKLMHNMRQTPFIVGITSFGLICGTSTPGVYTRVATYHEWIIDTMRKRGAAVDENTYNSTTCVHRHVKYREFYDGVVVHRNGNGSVELNVLNYMFPLYPHVPRHLARLGWSKGVGHSNCFGVIVDEDTVLTVADCTDFNGLPVDQIVHPKVVSISKIHIHPRYTKGSSYNNIAILKLGSLLDFQQQIAPTCIWVERKWPFGDASVLGIGRKDLVEPLYSNNNIEIDPTYGFLTIRNRIRNTSSCVVGDGELSRLKHGLAQEHVCAGYDFYIVPEMCNLPTGGPLDRSMSRKEGIYTFTMGLSQFGQDCGFGDHMIATRLASHVEWMKSILLPNYHDHSSSVVFLDTDRHERDHCEIDQSTPGRCAKISDCPNYWQQFVSQGKAKFCSTSGVVCCPESVLHSKTKQPLETELERCPSLVSKLKPLSRNGSLVQIGFDTEDWYDFRCVGAIISAQLVLTTASCFGDEVPPVVRLSFSETIVPIESIILHEDYNVTDKTNDIAIIKLEQSIVWTPHLFPSCLWINQTHTPLVMKLVRRDEDIFAVKYMLPLYNTDCQRAHPYPLQRSQLCAKEPYSPKTCANSGDMLRSDGEDGASFLVGLAQPSEDCESRNYITLTRISRLVGWVKQALDPAYWES